MHALPKCAGIEYVPGRAGSVSTSERTGSCRECSDPEDTEFGIGHSRKREGVDNRVEIGDD